MRPLLPIALLVLAAAAPAAAAPRSSVPGNVLLIADVAETARRSMPSALWRKLAAEHVGARAVTTEEGTALPDEARCRTAHALYAVLATFERATRLPGLAQDTDRVYGVARFTVRNCLTGVVAPTRTIAIESDPLPIAERGDSEQTAERTWEHAVRTTLAREPLVLGAVARIARIDNGIVFLEGAGGFAVHQVLRDFADPAAKPHAPVELVVTEIVGRYVQAAVVGNGRPQVGDYVEAAPAATASPAPRR